MFHGKSSDMSIKPSDKTSPSFSNPPAALFLSQRLKNNRMQCNDHWLFVLAPVFQIRILSTFQLLSKCFVRTPSSLLFSVNWWINPISHSQPWNVIPYALWWEGWNGRVEHLDPPFRSPFGYFPLPLTFFIYFFYIWRAKKPNWIHPFSHSYPFFTLLNQIRFLHFYTFKCFVKPSFLIWDQILIKHSLTTHLAVVLNSLISLLFIYVQRVEGVTNRVFEMQAAPSCYGSMVASTSEEAPTTSRGSVTMWVLQSRTTIWRHGSPTTKFVYSPQQWSDILTSSKYTHIHRITPTESAMFFWRKNFRPPSRDITRPSIRAKFGEKEKKCRQFLFATQELAAPWMMGIRSVGQFVGWSNKKWLVHTYTSYSLVTPSLQTFVLGPSFCRLYYDAPSVYLHKRDP